MLKIGRVNSLKSMTDVFLPRFCTACEKKLESCEEVICPECLKAIKPPGKSRIDAEFRRKFESEKLISGFCAAFLFEEGKAFQRLIHSIKYQGRYQNALFLGRLAAEKLKDEILSWNCDLIIPVPLHPVKKAERGYNQSYYIARGLCRAVGIPLENKILRRRRFTETQTALNVSERRANMKGAFSVKKRADIKGKRVIILDDVITSGSTISECARVLLDSGAIKVYAVSAGLAL